MMSIRKTGVALLLSSLAALAPAASAVAAPAGDEYLPKVPKAAGKEVVGNPQQGEGASVVSPTVRGTSSDTGGSGNGKAKQSKNSKQNKQNNAQAPPLAPAADTGDSSGGGNALFSPIVLLMIAGVVCVAVAMVMRRRKVKTLQYRAAKRRKRSAKSSRPTPEGEIVGSGKTRS